MSDMLTSHDTPPGAHLSPGTPADQGSLLGAQIDACVTALGQAYPAAFGKPGQPLMIGIAKQGLDALGGRYSNRVIALAIGRHVRTRAYLQGVQAGGDRVGLAGENRGAVAEREREFARTQLIEWDADLQGIDTDRLRKMRSQLLRRFEVFHRSVEEFADKLGLDVEFTRGRLRRALAERVARADQARDLVQRWRASGLSKFAFAKRQNIKHRALDTAMERANQDLAPLAARLGGL